MQFIIKYMGKFFYKIYKIFVQSHHNELIYKLKLRYPNSIILPNVSITPDCILGNHTVIHSNVSLSNVIIGDYSYILSSINNTTIGKFCSIASGCAIGIGKHPSKDFVSTFPAFFSKNNSGCLISFATEDSFNEFERIEIGNDVWIGMNSIILDGVRIGDGAIIGAGSVVTKDVDDYAIVGGVPAKLIRYRFTKEQIEFLKKFKWWDKDIEWIKKNWKSFQNIDDFLKNVVENL
ncbi:MAG: DapH/DapD/GlmU-related protein [Candidatus Methanoperedens sp.]|nr:DapH/DapD/GlmU-related protein [Candidatus Methanoperedens sp.]